MEGVTPLAATDTEGAELTTPAVEEGTAGEESPAAPDGDAAAETTADEGLYELMCLLLSGLKCYTLLVYI